MSLLEKRIINDARRKAEGELDYKFQNFEEYLIFVTGFLSYEKHEVIRQHLKEVKELVLPEYLEAAGNQGIEAFYHKVRKLPD